MSYEDQLKSLTNPTFSDIIEVAHQHLPKEVQLFPWIGLNLSNDLVTQEQILQYLCSYGKNQEIFLENTWSHIPNAQRLFCKKSTIIDWGSRLGLAICCFIDSLRAKNIDYFIDKVILIDESRLETKLAKLHLECYIETSKIQIINKRVEEIKLNDIKVSTKNTIHLFTDTLSRTGLQTEQFANSLTQLTSGEQVFICSESANLCPNINSFVKAMGISNQDLIATTNDNPDNKMLRSLIFTMTNKNSEIIKKEYCQMDNIANENIILNRILNKVNVTGYSELDKILEFYRTVIELERSKEPDIKNFYPYPIHFQENGKENIILIDFPCNKVFYKNFKDNRTEKWPKDLYIGLTVTVKTTPYRLVCTVINNDDLKYFDPDSELLPCRIKDFNIDTRYSEELQLSSEKVDEIDVAIKRAASFTDLKKIIRQHIDEEAIISDEIYLALSQRNPALSQISSELKKLDSTQVKANPILSAFLTDSYFENILDNISTDELIQITPMDESQSKIVAHALNNRLSVVTGAPGTGKTQVILNILANALLRGKSVLVTSKNNKAVDNVKERFDAIDKTGYLLRFGAKKLTTEITLPAINNVQEQLAKIKNKPCDYVSLNNKYKSAIKQIREACSLLKKGEKLPAKLIESQSVIDYKKQEIEQEELFHNQQKAELSRAFYNFEIFNNINIRNTEENLSALKVLRSNLQRKYSGFGKVWNNWFNKNKHAEMLLNHFEQFSHEIKRNIHTLNIHDNIHNFRNGNEIITQCTTIIKYIDRICDYRRKLSTELIRHTGVKDNIIKAIEAEQKRYNEILTEATEIENKRQQLSSTIENSKQIISTIGIDLLSAYILQLKQQNEVKNKISNYKEYLPDNIPWKSEHILEFIRNTKSFLEVFKLISVTSLSIKGSFPMHNELFDILVIDEASQCDIASAIPLIYRAKQVVIIGDPMQLKHITSVKTDEEKVIKKYIDLDGCPYIKYAEKSLWDYSKNIVARADRNNDSIMLENHYRCHHDIINFSNKMFYGRNLQNLIVKTDESKMSASPLGIIMVDVKGTQMSNNENINLIEVQKCIELAIKLSDAHPNLSIGIVTPFRQQAEALNTAIQKRHIDKIDANTVHKYQGDEKDIMIYSLVVTDNSPASKIYWIDKVIPNLVNVAVTRARQTLYIVGNADYIKKMSSNKNPLGYLIRYAQNNHQ